MGNLWDTCCRAEEHDMDDGDPSKEQHLLTSALRIPSSLPSLQSKAELRRESRRVVRIESLSPMIEVDDEYESGSQFSEESTANAQNVPLLSGGSSRTPVTGSPTLSTANQLPKYSSGLRLLLANAALKARDTNDIEQKDESEAKNEGNRGLRRVERHDSLHTVLPSNDQGVMFASAPVAAMKDPELPRGLTFGFLDDSAVSRMNFQNTLKNSLFGSELSFVRGSAISEAKNFPQEVIEKKPDIVVLDNCLDYEVSPGVYQSLKGTDLAREIRQKGFEGCIILQSEQESLKNEVDFDVVDGITGKSKATSSFAIARMVALARRKHKISGAFNMPSSTASSWNSRAESSFSFDIGEMDMRNRLELHDSAEDIGQ